jgi:ABC-type multidrug transport system fused ATPase/permease subunit
MKKAAPNLHRNRGWYTISIVLVIILGLASRRYPQILPAILDKYPGDALWPIVVFLAAGVVLQRTSTWKIAGLALAISYIVEVAQLYQAPWIVAIRRTTIGHLFLGSQFMWEDLVAYRTHLRSF